MGLVGNHDSIPGSPPDNFENENEDEQTVALKLLAGQPVPVQPGQAYNLRLQKLMNFLQNSRAAQRELLNNSQAQEAVKQRAKDLQFQIQQQQNAVIGRGGPAFAPKGVGEY